MESITRFLEKRLRLRVNRDKSAVGRPWERKFLGYSIPWHNKPETQGGAGICQKDEGAHPGNRAKRPRAVPAQGDQGTESRCYEDG